MNSYYFDTLPVHPQPESLESFTSYLIRLAEANGIQTIFELFKLCFPGEPRGFTLHSGDFPPRSFGALPLVAACPKSTLLATTFYYLAQKFNRKPEPRPLSMFMKGTLSSGLRYCPECVAERGYYSLVWRFLDLKGCPEHGCYLHDHCQHCGQKIPLITQPLRLGICPICGNDLRLDQTERLTRSTQQTAQATYQDFVFLLSPLSTESPDRPMVEFLGEQFIRWRQLRRLKLIDAGDYMGQSPKGIYFIERGSEHRSTRFQWHLLYADFLKVRFQTMFETPLPSQPVSTFEDRLVEKVQQAIACLEQKGELATGPAIYRLSGVAVRTMSSYPQIKALCNTSRTRWYQQRELELVNQAHLIATTMFKETGKPIVMRELYRRIGWSASGLKVYPRVKAALKQVVEQTQIQYEARILKEVQTALTQLEAIGQKVSKEAISDLTGVSLKTMKSLPTVRAFVKEQVLDRKQEHWIKQFQQREQKLVTEVQQAIETLQANGQSVTWEAVGRIANRRKSTLQKYPRVQLLFKEVFLIKSQRPKP